ncbi:MAG: NAD(P)/FAD-dependent oxidoreductase [Flavobacteriales bacterium]
MKNKQNNHTYFETCLDCKGEGKKRQKLRKKVRLEHQEKLNKLKPNEEIPVKPKGHLTLCETCQGSGLRQSDSFPEPDKENYPHLAIIGGGIGGTALAVACLHRGIPFTLFERDASFDERKQGYGLTLQQASRAISGFGLFSLDDGIISTRHVVHSTEGKIIGEWGLRKWMKTEIKSDPKKTNVHIARQSLRLSLLEQLGEKNSVKWNHQLVSFSENEEGVDLNFEVNGELKTVQADLVIGADGIRSSVRKNLIGEDNTPLRYLDCIVILGICKLTKLHDIESPLLDSATVFQTANGTERMYMMPYDSESIMWQFSFPFSEKEAKELSSKGALALKNETLKRTQWHSPIPEIVEATETSLISGYPVYDRNLLKPELLNKANRITLIGDAAHPMSPYKGQGANQALLDALILARTITRNCRPNSNWKQHEIRESVLNEFEKEMLERTASKVKDSAAAAKFLHSPEVLREANEPRGRRLKKEGK